MANDTLTAPRDRDAAKSAISDYRREIDALDAEIAPLMVRRAALAFSIQEIKRDAGIPALDRAREDAVMTNFDTACLAIAPAARGALPFRALAVGRRLAVRAFASFVRDGVFVTNKAPSYPPGARSPIGFELTAAAQKIVERNAERGSSASPASPASPASLASPARLSGSAH